MLHTENHGESISEESYIHAQKRNKEFLRDETRLKIVVLYLNEV